MNILFVIVALVNAVSILFLVLTLRRLRKYSHQMLLEESQYTRMFGRVDLGAWLYGYVFFVLFYGVVLWFIIL